ncbi:MAG: hypothetical protein ACXABY_10545 [Candidatus Thorarchaeota archaeon]
MKEDEFRQIEKAAMCPPILSSTSIPKPKKKIKAPYKFRIFSGYAHWDFFRINHALEFAHKRFHDSGWTLQIWDTAMRVWMGPSSPMGRMTNDPSRLNFNGFMPVSKDGKTYVGRTWLKQEDSQSSSEGTSETKAKEKQPNTTSSSTVQKRHTALGTPYYVSVAPGGQARHPHAPGWCIPA